MTITIVYILLLLIKIITAIPSNSYYLINIDTNVPVNTSYCSNILTNKNLYHIPPQCHKHILCNAHNCDDKSYRCIKIRETLCCLYKYIKRTCSNRNFKDNFRTIYFQISIEHGYCEINLERIEQNDTSYCISNDYEITTRRSITLSKLSRKRFHRYHHVTSQKNTSSKSSLLCINLIILLLSMLL